MAFYWCVTESFPDREIKRRTAEFDCVEDAHKWLQSHGYYYDSAACGWYKKNETDWAIIERKRRKVK